MFTHAADQRIRVALIDAGLSPIANGVQVTQAQISGITGHPIVVAHIQHINVEDMVHVVANRISETKITCWVTWTRTGAGQCLAADSYDFEIPRGQCAPLASLINHCGDAILPIYAATPILDEDDQDPDLVQMWYDDAL